MKAARHWLLIDLRDGLRSQPGRIGLSFAALAVGAMALTLLLTMLAGLDRRAATVVHELGANVFALVRSTESPGAGGPGFSSQQVEMLRENLPAAELAAVRQYKVALPGREEALTVQATEPSLLAVRQWKMAAGRFLDAADLARAQRHAVLTGALARELHLGVGDTLTLRSTPLTIVGVLRAQGDSLSEYSVESGLAPGPSALFLPASVAPNWVDARQAPGKAVDVLFVQPHRESDYARYLTASRRMLQQPGSQASVSWVTPDVLLAGLKRLRQTLKLTLGSIAVLCLVLGGTTLMSLMVANVRDRVTEIGLRRALGATRGDVATLFVAEACLVTAAAALFGSLVVHGVLWFAGSALPVPLAFGWKTLCLPVLVAAVLGMLFAYWPARSAAHILPAEALRND